MKTYQNGEEMREDLPELTPGIFVMYSNWPHMVIETKQGNRLAAMQKPYGYIKKTAIQLRKDKEDPDIVHIYSEFNGRYQYHIAVTHIDMVVDGLFKGIDNLRDKLNKHDSLWISYEPKIEGSI